MLINCKFNEIQYKELKEKLRYNNILSDDFLRDVYNNNLNWRLERLISINNNFDNNIDYYNISESYIKGWINLLREWVFVSIRKDLKTHLYMAKIKNHPKYVKIGITYDINQRSNFENNPYYDYHILRTFDNRYVAAYCEYKLRTLYCSHGSEHLDINIINEVRLYINNLHYNNNCKEELKLLGWKF